MIRNNITLYFLCFLLSGIGAWLVAKYGYRFKLLDKPSERSSHINVIPKGGGIGILAGFFTGAIFLNLPAFFWFPTLILSIISFIGDRVNIAPLYRLIFQFAASFVVLLGLRNYDSLLFSSYFEIVPIMVFIVGTTNYYNFMDGINGIAGITGIVAFGLLSFYGMSREVYPQTNILTISLAISCLGFLPFNLSKAKVFMGDVGSILLGFVFAVMVVWYSNDLLTFLCLASFLFPFYADEITTELVRLKNGEKLWEPHRKHLYQLLANEYNIPHWKISLGYGIAQLIVGMSVMLLLRCGIFYIVSILSIYFCIFSVISIAMRRNLMAPSV